MFNDSETLSWFSLQWFSPSTLSQFEWDRPVYLYALAGIPLLFMLRWLIQHLAGQKLALGWKRKQMRSGLATWLRFVPDFVFACFVALVLLALARPQRTNEKVEQWTEGIDIMLVIDTSESMKIEDFKPNRLESAKRVASDFINGRFQDRIGIVVFSGDAYSLSPLTTDYDLLKAYLEDIGFGMMDKRGTAIGSALAVATNRMRESESKSKVMILLSDGDNTAGNIDPITAAQLSQKFDIKLYTIGIGREGRVPYGKDFLGRTRYIENSLDETTLRKIADIGDGRFYRVSDDEALQEVFQMIDQYEKAEIKESRYKDTKDFYTVYLYWALVFLMLWLLLKQTFISNILQD